MRLASSLLALALLAACSGSTWRKGNLHTHSLWSDGNDFPEVISKWYLDHGYDFLAMSDHNILEEGDKWMKVDDIVRRGGRRALERYRQEFGRQWVETREVDGKLEVRLKTLAEYRRLLEYPGEFLLIQSEEISDRFGNKPIHMNFDPQGRLWVASSEAYPMIEVGQSMPDKILVLEDSDST